VIGLNALHNLGAGAEREHRCRNVLTILVALVTIVLTTETRATPPAGLPTGAIAYFDFGSAMGGTIPNQVVSAVPWLTTRGTDFQVAGDGITWNRNIGGFTFTFPFDPNRGTYAQNTTSFPNSFGSGGTMAVRLRLDASVASLGQASSMGIITFRPDPDINIHRVPPRSLEIKREGATEPIFFRVREGNNSIGYNNEFNDEADSDALTNPTSDKTAIVVWDAATLRLYVDGVLSGTKSRVTADHPTPSYRIMVAVQPSLIHGGDNQYFKGTLHALALYNRPLSAAEVATLNVVLAGAPARVPQPPQNLVVQ
jgi:hypothetical protein